MWSTPDDWTYFAEGGKHVIFRYCQHHQPNSQHADSVSHRDNLEKAAGHFYGHVLRVQKNDLVRIAMRNLAENEKNLSHSKHFTYDLSVTNDSPSSSEVFQKRIVQPLLGRCYLNVPSIVALHATFCSHLYFSALRSGKIPSSRISSWQPQERYQDGMERNFNKLNAALIRDHSILTPHPIACSVTHSNESGTVSVEIKPKAGYLATSPLVLPENRCKYYRSRYSLQQELMKRGFIRRGWFHQKSKVPHASIECHDFNMSEYSPLRLFSGNSIDIKDSILNLSKNMQNNFRVWYNGEQIFGEAENHSKAVYDMILRKIFSDQCISLKSNEARSMLLDVIAEVVVKVLEKETLLENLLKLQKLDIIDGDGAVLLYKRLVNLCGDSVVEAENLLDQNLLIDDVFMEQDCSDRCHSKFGDLFASPYLIPHCRALNKMLEDCSQYQTYLQHQIKMGKIAEENIANEFHERCQKNVNNLSKEACIFLLQNWLLSLTMCDVSFFVTFQCFTLTDEMIFPMHEQSLSDIHERNTHCGLFTCNWDVSLQLPKVAVHYDLKVIDCDPKPSKKLRTREFWESNFKHCSNSFSTNGEILNE